MRINSYSARLTEVSIGGNEMNIRSDFDTEFREFDDSMLFLKPDEEREARLQFSERIRKLIAAFPNDADLYHKLGLCLYDLHTWTEQEKVDIEIAFHRALLLDNDSVFSHIFLTHFYFDIAEYQLALNAGRIGDVLTKGVPMWRRVKLREIELCCRIYLGVIADSDLNVQLTELGAEFGHLKEDEREAASPNELLAAIRQTSEQWNTISLERWSWLTSGELR
jgi:hypothetical protein